MSLSKIVFSHFRSLLKAPAAANVVKTGERQWKESFLIKVLHDCRELRTENGIENFHNALIE